MSLALIQLPSTALVSQRQGQADNSCALVRYQPRMSARMEAIALIWLARVFEEILGPVARSMYPNNVGNRLRSSMEPMCIEDVDSQCKSKKKHTREATARAQRRKADEARKRHAEAQRLKKLHHSLREELAALERASKNVYSLLEHIYAHHPPRGKCHVDPSKLNADNVRKSVREALRDYHPDRQRRMSAGGTEKEVEAAEDEWTALCIEISKALAAKHDILKN